MIFLDEVKSSVSNRWCAGLCNLAYCDRITIELNKHENRWALCIYHAWIHSALVCTSFSSHPSLLLFSDLRRTSIRADTKSNLLAECALLLSNSPPPPCTSLMNSPDNSDNTRRSWCYLYTNTTICVWKPVGENSHHSHNIHNRGLFTNISPSLTVLLFSGQTWEGSEWLNNLLSHCEGYHFQSGVAMSHRCDDNFTSSCTPSHS